MRVLWAGLRAVWRAIDATRRVLLNLLFLALLAVLGVWGVASLPKSMAERTALVVEIDGSLVEQAGGNNRRGFAALLPGSTPRQTRLRDVLRGLDAAAGDPRIAHVVLRVDGLGSAGLTSLRELAAAIERVKAAGKPVLAYADGYSQRAYYLAAHASEVYLHPMGTVEITGLGGHRSYYKTLFDKLGVEAHVVRAGKYKNAAETWSASGPSPETMEADKSLIDPLWRLYTGGVEKARKLPAGAIDQSLEQLPAQLAAAGGDMAKFALQARWVDKLISEDQWRKLLVERGASDDDGKTYRRIALGEYLSKQKEPAARGDAVGIVIAEGAIVDGEASAGRVGGRSTAALIRGAREDKSIKALVLRVRSPGGSAFASEQVRRELQLTREAGKPVVVSMGDVAASGGYWISMAADEVIADEATITGSIGVVGLLPTAEKAMDKLGINAAGYTTHWLVDAYDVRRGLDPRLEKLIQMSIDQIYGDFIQRVATARKRTPEQIGAVAQGRVWTGAQAKELGLVDRTGTLADALKAAATRAKLPADARSVYFERSRSRFDQLLGWLPLGVADAWVGVMASSSGAESALGAQVAGAMPGIEQDLALFTSLMQGATALRPAVQAHCLCELTP